jgi:hypothetical protein
MPCYDSRTDDERNRIRELLDGGGSQFGGGGGYSGPSFTWETKIPLVVKVPKSTIDQTALLCSTCRVLARLGYDFDENPALSQWWEAHKKEDAKPKE